LLAATSVIPWLYMISNIYITRGNINKNSSYWSGGCGADLVIYNY